MLRGRTRSQSWPSTSSSRRSPIVRSISRLAISWVGTYLATGAPRSARFPVGIARDCCTERSEDSDEDRQVGGSAPGRRPIEDIDDVEKDGQRPRTQRDIRDHRMKWMPEPGPVDEGFDGVSGPAHDLVGAPDELLGEIGDWLQPALLIDEPVDDMTQHTVLLSQSDFALTTVCVQESA